MTVNLIQAQHTILNLGKKNTKPTTPTTLEGRYKVQDIIILNLKSLKIQYGERQELYDVEDESIMKYDSIRHGYNTRRNYKKNDLQYKYSYD